MVTLNFFDKGSPYLGQPLLTPERTAKEVSFILSQFNLPLGARVLDVGCGFGRHTIELARRGYDVVGIDPSEAMIVSARARAAAAGVAPVFHQVSGESFVSQAGFDAAICLFTTLGQISEDGENSGLVERVYDVLRPAGLLAVETPQRDWVIQHLKPAERLGEGERYTDVIRRFDAVDNSVTEIFELVSPESIQSYILRYRLFSQPELSALLRGTGFRVQATFGGYDGNPLNSDSAVMLLIGLK